MTKGEYIPRSEVIEKLFRARNHSRSAPFRHGLEQAAGIINCQDGIDLEPDQLEVTYHCDNKNVIKVGVEFRFFPSEAGDRIEDEGLYYMELRSKKTQRIYRAWRMYMTEEDIKNLEKQLHDIVEQEK